MRTWYSRLQRAVLAALLLVLGLGAAPPVGSLYEGTWKVSFPNQKLDVTLWLIHLDSGAKKARLVSGLGEYARTRLGEAKAGSSGLTLTLLAGRNEFRLVTRPPSPQAKDRMFGSLRLGNQVMPVWLQRTTLEELTQENAVRESPGQADLQAARKRIESEDRLRDIRAVIERHSGQPIHFLALQALLGELIARKSPTSAFRQPVEDYRRLAARHGDEMLVSANLDLARYLLSYSRAVPLAVESARAAAAVLRDDHAFNMKLSAQLTLAAALQAAGKAEAMAPVLRDLGRLVDGFVAEAGSGEARLVALGEMAATLLSSPAAAVADRGLEYAREAVKLAGPDVQLARRVAAHKLLARGLEARGKKDEAKKLEPVIEQFEIELDRAYLKENIPFPVETFGRRKGKSDRVVLVELFTNAVNRQMVAATVAFDAGLKAYRAKDVAFLQYHVGFRDPDLSPLVNLAGQAREAFYKGDLEGLPALFIDGKLTPPLGGARHRGQNSFELLREHLDRALETPSGATLALEVSRKGDSITARARVSGVKKPGRQVRLLLALVEERVRYQDSSGVRLHHHLVRSFLGPANGYAIEKKEETQTASISLAQLHKSLAAYMAGLEKKVGGQWTARPLDLEKLRVIAFVQDEETRQVLQAAQAIVPAK